MIEVMFAVRKDGFKVKKDLLIFKFQVSVYIFKCTYCYQRGHAGNKSLLRQNPPILIWGWPL